MIKNHFFTDLVLRPASVQRPKTTINKATIQFCETESKERIPLETIHLRNVIYETFT